MDSGTKLLAGIGILVVGALGLLVVMAMIGTAVLMMGAPADAPAGTVTTSSNGGGGSGVAETTRTTATPEETTRTTTTPEGTPIVIRIEYSGEWQGSVSFAGKSKSIDGVGVTEYKITGPSPNIVSVAIQKMETSGTLTVKISHKGEVLKQSSTSADYGVVSLAVKFY